MPQNAENPSFDYHFLTSLCLGMPDYSGSPLEVSQPSPNADLFLHSPKSLGSQSSEHGELLVKPRTYKLLAHARAVQLA